MYSLDVDLIPVGKLQSQGLSKCTYYRSVILIKLALLLIRSHHVDFIVVKAPLPAQTTEYQLSIITQRAISSCEESDTSSVP